MSLSRNKQDFINEASSKIPDFNEDLVSRAWDFAKERYTADQRDNCETNSSEPFSVANHLLAVDCDSATITAALLFGLVECRCASIKEIKGRFGSDIASLVEDVAKLAPLDSPPDRNWMSKEARRENLRRFFVATVEDPHVALIKLADRLYRLTTFGALTEDRKRKMAQESLDTFAPLAEALELGAFQSRIQELAFRYLEPETYCDLEQRLGEKWKESKKIRDIAVASLEGALKDAGINARVYDRKKEIYSIHQKMMSYKLEFDELYDIIGIRIIVDTKDDCFKAKSVVDRLGMEVRCDDWISKPRGPGGYQSLHIIVRMPEELEGVLVEVQIRSKEMHLHAERGSAAHWLYKLDGFSYNPDFIMKINALRETLEKKMNPIERFLRFPAEDSNTSFEDIPEYMRGEVDTHKVRGKVQVEKFASKIYAFSPGGDVIALPKGSTPKDFARRIHSDIAQEYCGALINGKHVPSDYKLDDGDVVEIIRCIHVFSPKGKEVVLPKGSTAIDFAYYIHTDIGHECRGAWVNGKYVSPDYELRNGDTVKIDRCEGSAPDPSWLTDGKVKSHQAQHKIREYFQAKNGLRLR